MGHDLDPFGRKKDENPLASLGWHGDETGSSAELEPAPAESATPPPRAAPVTAGTHAPPRERPSEDPANGWPAPGADSGGHTIPRPRRPRQRAPAGRVIRGLVLLAVVIAVLGGALGTLVDEGVERADRFVRELEPPDVQAPAVPGSDERAPSGRAQATLPARGLSVNSLLRPAAFGRAIIRLRTGGYGRLTNLRVAPDRIDATMLTKGGRLRLLQVVPGGAVRVLQTTTAGGFAGARTMTLKGMVATAPSRLARSAARRLGQPASRVDYLVLSDFGGTRQWNAYFKGGPIFSADARGRITRRVS